MTSHLRFSVVLPIVGCALMLGGCGGDAGKLAGTWRRDLYSEGEVRMHVGSDGKMELMLPSPRWPDSVDMRASMVMKGDTIIFQADTTASACQKSEARYMATKTADQLQIAGVGMDPCGSRHAGLVGTWTKS